ncbi:MAG: hypothetical protein ABL890_04700 [Candidatus Peribacteraceae bacterium]
MMNSLPLQTRQTLKALGFSDNECKVLLPLFSAKSMSSKDLSKQTTLSFEAVHFALHALEKKKLIEITRKSGQDIVKMSTRQEFLEWIDDQRQINAEIYNEAKSSISTFLTTFAESAWKPEVMYFEGVDGIREIYEDMIREGTSIYSWTDIQKIYETLGDYMHEFIRMRLKKKIKSYAIMPINVMNSEYAKKAQLRDTLFSSDLQINGEIRVYGDKVAVITFHKKKPVGFVFSGPIIASLFRGMFAHAWNSCNHGGGKKTKLDLRG